MKEQGDLFFSCVPVSVKRLDQDKDADENVDADHVRTGRPVESEHSFGLFTQREERDIDFRGEWDRVDELMIIKFGESGHPVFRATSPFSRGTLESKGGGKLSSFSALN